MGCVVCRLSLVTKFHLQWSTYVWYLTHFSASVKIRFYHLRVDILYGTNTYFVTTTFNGKTKLWFLNLPQSAACVHAYGVIVSCT